MTARNVVVLPAPLRPMMVTHSPFLTSSETPTVQDLVHAWTEVPLNPYYAAAFEYKSPVDFLHSLVDILRDCRDVHSAAPEEPAAGGPETGGGLAALLPIARPGVSRHLRVLREAGLVDVREEAHRRVYSLRPEPLAEVDEWLGRYRALWENRLDALHTEIARGKHERRSTR